MPVYEHSFETIQKYLFQFFSTKTKYLRIGLRGAEQKKMFEICILNLFKGRSIGI